MLPLPAAARSKTGDLVPKVLGSNLTHRKARSAQVGLSFYVLTIFFVVIILVGLGYLKMEVLHVVEGVVTIVISFWFMRQRTSVDEDHLGVAAPAPAAPAPAAPVHANPIQPAGPAT
jgi:hypothetical protein